MKWYALENPDGSIEAITGKRVYMMLLHEYTGKHPMPVPTDEEAAAHGMYPLDIDPKPVFKGGIPVPVVTKRNGKYIGGWKV